MICYTDLHHVPFEIDDEDWEIVKHYTWHLSPRGYICTHYRRYGQLQLHLLLMGRAADGLQWDHKNRNKLDNHRENFRQVTDTINHRNRGLSKANTSGSVGIQRIGRHEPKKYRATLKIDGQQFYSPHCDTLEEAIYERQKLENEFWRDQR